MSPLLAWMCMPQGSLASGCPTPGSSAWAAKGALRVFVSIYNKPSGTALAEQISAVRWLSSGGLTLHLPILDALHLGGSATSARFLGWWQDSRATQDTFYNQDDPSIQEEVLDSRLRGSVPRVLRFFLRFYGIILAELQIDPQLESMIRPKARGLHSIWNAILQITFSIWLFFKTTRVLLKTFKRRTRGLLGTTREDFKTTQGSAEVPSSLGILQVFLRTFSL
jgi:hypothetical protein